MASPASSSDAPPGAESSALQRHNIVTSSLNVTSRQQKNGDVIVIPKQGWCTSVEAAPAFRDQCMSTWVGDKFCWGWGFLVLSMATILRWEGSCSENSQRMALRGGLRSIKPRFRAELTILTTAAPPVHLRSRTAWPGHYPGCGAAACEQACAGFCT